MLLDVDRRPRQTPSAFFSRNGARVMSLAGRLTTPDHPLVAFPA
jgi:hypothetical protein